MSETQAHVWLNGTGAELTVRYPGVGPVVKGELPFLAMAARLAGTPELLRFTYELTDPETGETTYGAARLLLESVPDPRDVPPAPLQLPTADHPYYAPAATPSVHECRDCPKHGGIGFDCNHLVRGRRLADRCGWCQARGYEPDQEIPPKP